MRKHHKKITSTHGKLKLKSHYLVRNNTNISNNSKRKKENKT